MFPLNGEALHWRFVDVPNIVPEARLATVPEGDVPLLDRTVPLEEQLARSPRFVREDGGAVLFHRFVAVHFHRGEDYDPEPHYGFANGRVAFTFTASNSFGVWNCVDPILLSPDAAAASFDAIGDKNWRQPVTLSLGLREELFFALFDIARVRPAHGAGWPTILEYDRGRLGEYRVKYRNEAFRWNGIRFGSHLDMIAGLPMRSPLSVARTTVASAHGLPAAPGWLSRLLLKK